MLSNEGINNLNLLKYWALKTWEENVIFIKETGTQIPVDAFTIEMRVYKKFKVLIEYEVSTFAFKLWTGNKYEYIDRFTNNKIIYGFDSMKTENIQNNFKILDVILKKL